MGLIFFYSINKQLTRQETKQKFWNSVVDSQTYTCVSELHVNLGLRAGGRCTCRSDAKGRYDQELGSSY